MSVLSVINPWNDTALGYLSRKYIDGWHMELENCSSHSPQSTSSDMEVKLPQLHKFKICEEEERRDIWEQKNDCEL